MNWTQKQINLGEIIVGKKQTVIFQATRDLDIINLESSCGCSKPSYNKETKQLIVIYTPDAIPKHLQSVGKYNTTKSVTITYADGTSEVLSFKSTILKK